MLQANKAGWLIDFEGGKDAKQSGKRHISVDETIDVLGTLRAARLPAIETRERFGPWQSGVNQYG